MEYTKYLEQFNRFQQINRREDKFTPLNHSYMFTLRILLIKATNNARIGEKNADAIEKIGVRYWEL